MNIAFITDAPRIAGSEVWLRETLPRLKAHGIHSSLLISNRPKLDYLESLKLQDIEVIRYSDLSQTPKLTQNHKLRILQAWNHSTYRLLRDLRQPTLTLVHDQLEFFYPFGIRYLNRLGFTLSKSVGLRQSNGVITVSSWGAQFLETKLGVKNAISIHNGVDIERFSPVNLEQRAALRKFYGFDGFIVLVPGRMTLEKNQLLAVQVAQKLPQVRFIFLGDDDSPVGGLCKWLARDLPNVMFWGKRNDIPPLYQAADALLQPTLAENQSLVTLEAMACALPIVSSNIPAQLELLDHQVTGLVYPPQVSTMKAGLDLLFQQPDLAKRIGAAARAKILQKHTLDLSAAEFARVILHRA